MIFQEQLITIGLSSLSLYSLTISCSPWSLKLDMSFVTRIWSNDRARDKFSLARLLGMYPKYDWILYFFISLFLYP